MKTLALTLFLVMYVLMIALPKYRPFYALGVAGIYVAAGILPLSAVAGVINWNVLLMITGTMILVYYFTESGMPALLADRILKRAGNLLQVIIFMSLFAGIISAFLDNVATVLMVAPVALAICRRLQVSPVGMILSIAVSSNLQGAATLVGDTTSILLGDYAGMNFLDFLWMQGRTGIFFAVELGALATIPVMMLLFRKEKQPVSAGEDVKVQDYIPSVMLVLMVLLLIGVSFLPDTPSVTNGLVCCALAVVTMVIDLLREKKTAHFTEALRGLDFETLGLLLGLFLVIGGITEVGFIEDMAALLVKWGGGSLFLLYTLIVWGSVLISAFVDNIPYVATLLPVLQAVSLELGIAPYLLYFGLLTGATLGGNITPVGASANIAAVGLLRKEGYHVSFGAFLRIGIPYTLTAVLVGYLYIWFVWR